MTLTILRGDTERVNQTLEAATDRARRENDWKAAARCRFPDEFCQKVPESAQVSWQYLIALYGRRLLIPLFSI